MVLESYYPSCEKNFTKNPKSSADAVIEILPIMLGNKTDLLFNISKTLLHLS